MSADEYDDLDTDEPREYEELEEPEHNAVAWGRRPDPGDDLGTIADRAAVIREGFERAMGRHPVRADGSDHEDEPVEVQWRDPAPFPPEAIPAWVAESPWEQTEEQLAAELERAPLQAVDPEDDRMAEAIYVSHLQEPYGDVVPRWEQLGDHARDTYRRQARRTRELLGTDAGTPEPERVVLGFGSPAVAAEVLDTLRRWRDVDEVVLPSEIGALIERIESGNP